MTSEHMVLVATNDLVAQTRGRAVPSDAEDSVLRSGVGWVPANLALTSSGAIAPVHDFGSTGDLRLLPDRAACYDLPASDQLGALRLYLADQVDLAGRPWGGCPRTFARSALTTLEERFGLQVTAAFEHEFMMDTASTTPAFSFERLRAAEPMGSRLLALLDQLGLAPENWLPEYGVNQFEITTRPTDGLTAADHAVVLRDVVRDLALQLDRKATFTPLPHPDESGNGVHVHISLREADTGRPVLYDETQPGSLSDLGQRFAGGILRHANALAALTAPSPISYLRLQPHRWSSGGAFLADRNREALVRICPVVGLSSKGPADQLNLEFRAADATANPWLVLGALVHAGMSGLTSDAPPPHVFPEDMPEHELDSVPRLPASLEEALTSLREDQTALSWFDPTLINTYLQVKQAELDWMAEMDDVERCRVLADVY